MVAYTSLHYPGGTAAFADHPQGHNKYYEVIVLPAERPLHELCNTYKLDLLARPASGAPGTPARPYPVGVPCINEQKFEYDEKLN